MSETRMALGGASYEAGTTRITEIGGQGMITIRGDLDAPLLRKAAKKVTGVDFPGPGLCHSDGAKGLAWMSPDELLLFCPHAEVGDVLELLQTRFKDTHSLALDVSGARALFRVEGDRAREVLAKLAPVDLAPESFTPGMFRRTRLGQVAGAFWLDAEDAFHVICFRSVAQYVFDLLQDAARPGGEVGLFASGQEA